MTNRATASLMETLINDVRLQLEDAAKDPAGNLIPASAVEFERQNIEHAINNTFKFLALRAQIECPGQALIRTQTTYSESDSDNGIGMALPTTIPPDEIYCVEVLDDNVPRVIAYSPANEISRYEATQSPTSVRITDQLYYTLLSDATTPTLVRIKIRPQPGNPTIRIWHVAPPLIGTDRHPASLKWAELIALDAAVGLLAPSGRASPLQIARRAERLQQFDEYTGFRLEPDRVRFPAGRNW